MKYPLSRGAIRSHTMHAPNGPPTYALADAKHRCIRWQCCRLATTTQNRNSALHQIDEHSKQNKYLSIRTIIRTTARHMFSCTTTRSLRPFALAILAMALIPIPQSPVQADETGMASMHDWRRERGKICLVGHYHSGAGTGRTKKQARRAAIRSWQEFTAWEYGTSWAYFRRAASRSISVTRSASGWEATVEARACKRARTRRARRRSRGA